MSNQTKLDFYFSPFCPWAWRTALWMRQVAAARDIDVTWKVFSLAEVNKDNPAYQTRLSMSQNAEMLHIAARRHGGNEAIERLYMAMGDIRHGQDRAPDEDMFRESLRKAGLPEQLLDDINRDSSIKEELLAEHTFAVEKLDGFGVPIIKLEDQEQAFFGPVVDPVPTGQEALDLWDHTQWILRKGYLFEYKRERHFRPGPQPVIDPRQAATV
ncbi:MAG: DsbA family protein [Chloroflexi bacterium]|nr:DsbA family protein [Chloroflexota bacterium]